MSQQENTFFATQIVQETPQQHQNLPSESPEESPQVSPIKQEKIEEDPHSMKQLLIAFNSHDRQQKGLITLAAVEQILTSKTISITQEYHEMSLPLFQNLVSFDEFLFIYCLSENTSEFVQDKYLLCQKVDLRLIQFLKLLNNYRKKSERNGNYKEAKNSKKKIELIRQRELERRNKYLKILYENQMSSVEEKQKAKFQEFCKKWDQFMNQYEARAAGLVKETKEKHIVQIKEFQQITREQLTAKMHFSKYLLELQLKQKNLVKLQQYQKAGLVQIEIEQLKIKQLKERDVANQQTIDLRLRSFRKQQQSSLSTLLQKIQKDRNDHMKQRQSETEKLIVRNKSQITEIDRSYNQTAKRVYEALHNMGIQSQKLIKGVRK